MNKKFKTTIESFSKPNHQIFHYTRCITQKRVTSWESQLRVFAVSGNTALFEEVLQQWRAVGNTESDLTVRRFEPQSSRSRNDRSTARLFHLDFDWIWVIKSYYLKYACKVIIYSTKGFGKYIYTSYIFSFTYTYLISHRLNLKDSGYRRG